MHHAVWHENSSLHAILPPTISSVQEVVVKNPSRIRSALDIEDAGRLTSAFWGKPYR